MILCRFYILFHIPIIPDYLTYSDTVTIHFQFPKIVDFHFSQIIIINIRGSVLALCNDNNINTTLLFL